MAKKFTNGFYNSAVWKKTRDSYFQERLGICERCGRKGKIVHHKIYITPKNINDVNITLNKDNLELLCDSCHMLEHEGTSSTSSNVMFDSNGQLVERIEHSDSCRTLNE